MVIYDGLDLVIDVAGANPIFTQNGLLLSLITALEGALGLEVEVRTCKALHFWDIHAIGAMVAGISEGARAIRAALR